MAFAAGCALFGGSVAAAQTPVQPGGVATVVASVAVPAGAESVRFRVEPAAGVRPFGRPAGEQGVEPGGQVRLPFTFGVPALAPAGPLDLGRLHLEWATGASDSADLRVEVAARRAASFWVGAETVTAAPGGVIQVGYRLQNRGNAADTFRISVRAPDGWTVRLRPAAALVERGDTVAGTLELVVPRRAASGTQHAIRIELAGVDVLERRSFDAVVVSEEGWLGGVARLPATVFVGSSSAADGFPAAALHAAGEVRPGMRMAVALRLADPVDIVPAFRGQLGGPALRMAVESPSWDVRLGDLFSGAGVLTGPVSQGRGLEAEVRRGPVSAGVLVAAPRSHTVPEDGLLLQANASLESRLGAFGVSTASARRESPLFGESNRAGATATWSYRSPGHDASIEAGFLALSDTSGRSAGFTTVARYLGTFGAGSITARLRQVPGSTRSASSQGNEAFLSGTVQLAPAASAFGWIYAGSSPYVDGSPHPSAGGGAAGLRLLLPRAVEGEIVGSYRDARIVGDTLPARVTRSVRASLDVPVRALRSETDLEVGAVAGRAFHQLRSGLRWSAYRQWAWLGLSYRDSGPRATTVGLDLAGAVLVRSAELQGGLDLHSGASNQGASASFWSALALPLTDAVEIVLGVEHRPADPASAWRFSLGATRSFGLPLPLSRHSELRGIVFEDENGNLLRDPDEQTIPGVDLLLGFLRATTDEDGEFRFHDAAPGELRLDPRSTVHGFVLPPEARLPTAGRVEVPVIRTAVLELQLFLDRDGDARKDSLEAFAHGAVVSLRDASGRTRDAAAGPEGRVRFGGLAPGAYTLLVHDSGPGRAARPLEFQLLLTPGTTTTRTVAVPLRRREIRLPGGSPIPPAQSP